MDALVVAVAVVLSSYAGCAVLNLLRLDVEIGQLSDDDFRQ